jgi:hypothetical protein
VKGSVEVPVPPPGRAASRRAHVEGLDDRSPPAPVLPEGQDVVGAVVARRDLVEHGRDLVRPLLQAGAGHVAMIAPIWRDARGALLTLRSMSTGPLPVQGLSLVARTVPLEDPGPLLALLPQDSPLAWVRRGEGVVGWGAATVVRTGGVQRFAEAGAAWAELTRHAVVRDEVGLPGTGPLAFGSFAFSPRSPAGGVLIVPEVVVGTAAGAGG